MRKDYALVAGSGAIFGLVVFSAQIFVNMGLSLFEMSTLPFLFTIPLLLAYIGWKRKFHIFEKKHLTLWIIYGFFSIFIVVSQFGAVQLGASVAMTALLLYTQPLWTILVSKIFLKEKITKTGYLAGAGVLFGMLVLTNPFNIPPSSAAGILVGILGGISLSVWMVLGSVASKRGADPLASTFMQSLITLLFIFLIFPLLANITPSEVSSFSLNWSLGAWMLFFGFALITQFIGHVWYLEGTKTVPTNHAGILMLLEPVSAAVLAALFLSQAITWNIMLGGLIIIGANYYLVRKL